ncbi:MAG: hypothetical protein J5637_04225 [Prevotella sp.]|nr:hypothetical protein [Prevotella sp.]
MRTIFRQFILVLALSCSALPAMSQVKDMLKIINDRGFFMPHVQWLGDDGRMNSYLQDLDRKSTQSMEATLEAMVDDHQRAQQILTARQEILGKKLERKYLKNPSAKTLAKVDEILAKRFNDIERVKAAMENAAQVERRYEVLSSAITARLANPIHRSMPQGALKSFYYSSGNGFAGFHYEVSLKKVDGKNVLRIEEKRMIHDFDNAQTPPEAYDAVVADSVLQRVRDMVEEGKLYEIGSDYMPDYEIMDASNWSLSFTFEKGSISSGGYAAGPDHSDVLGRIIRYLTAIYDEQKPQAQHAEEQQ